MTQKRILQLGDPALRQIAAPVENFNDPDLKTLCDELMDMMLQAQGVGIAAPQIGVPLQILIIASRPTKRYPLAPELAPVLMLNPSFNLTEPELIKDWEGCLSVPGIRALVPRHLGLQIAYQDLNGQPRQIQLSGFPARVFQHEYDHLLGMVYLDRVENNRDIVAESEFFKLIAA